MNFCDCGLLVGCSPNNGALSGAGHFLSSTDNSLTPAVTSPQTDFEGTGAGAKVFFEGLEGEGADSVVEKTLFDSLVESSSFVDSLVASFSTGSLDTDVDFEVGFDSEEAAGTEGDGEVPMAATLAYETGEVIWKSLNVV